MEPKIKSKFALYLLGSFTLLPAMAIQQDNYDYNSANRALIRNGVQAVLMCNGLFTSKRSLEQIFSQELAYLDKPVGTVNGGQYTVNQALQAVAVGGGDAGPTARAAFRPGIGCVVMAPNQAFEDIESLPKLDLAYPEMDVSRVPWPKGDLIVSQPLAADIDSKALEASAKWSFERNSPEQVTLSLIVLHKGEIVLERYANGVNRTTRTRTWSTAKSIAVTLIGILSDAGMMHLDAPLDVQWLPDMQSNKTDPRNAITLRHVLNMSSGLYPVDSFGKEYVSGSGLSYWAGSSSSVGARQRGLVRAPGTHWDYENYDTLLAVSAMKNALKDKNSYREYPRRALLDKLGMRSTLISTDRFSNFILSSQVYSNARDLARFGLLYAQNGIWDGKRIISEAWIDFVRTPAPATASRGNFYGGQWWLVPDDRTDIPKNAYATSGNRGQYVIIVPSNDLVIVRRGLDYGEQGFNRWDLTREVLKAFSN